MLFNMKALVLLLLSVAAKVHGNDHGDCKEPNGCNWRYIAYFPNTFRTGASEKIAVATYNFPSQVTVNISILDKSKTLFSSKLYTIEPDELSELSYYIPHDAPERIYFHINGYGKTENGKEWKFSNTTKDDIIVAKLGYNIMIQTDRPLYKPGQKILGRIVVIDSKLKPVEGKLRKLVIESPSGSRMRQWNDVTLEDGLVSFDLQVSEKPVLGDWKIKVEIESYKKELKIGVNKYVLPKFEVKITPPSYLTYLSKEIKLEVCALYSYGKNVFGKLRAEICLKQRYYWNYSPDRKAKSCYEFNANIDGCRIIKIDPNYFGMRKLLESYISNKLDINAKVTEKATSLTLHAKQVSMPIESREIELSFETKESFKPGLPFKLKLFAKYPDGQLVEKVKVNVSIGTQGYSVYNLMKNNVIEVVNGVHNIDVPPVPFNAEKVRLKAVYRREKAFPKESKYRRESSTYSTIKPWYSPSHSYIQIEKPSRPFENGSYAEINVHYTTSSKEDIFRKIHYSVMCAGNIAATGSTQHLFRSGNSINDLSNSVDDKAPPEIIDSKGVILADDDAGKTNNGENENITTVPMPTTTPLFRIPYFTVPTRPPFPDTFSVGKFSIGLRITGKMFPMCRMVVYYVYKDEIVADSTDFDVIDEFHNKVSIGFDEKEVRPGEKTRLVVNGHPNSRVAIAAVDKSIHFLAEGNDIKKKDLHNIRERLDIPPGYVNDYDRCPSRWDRRRSRRSFIPFGGSDYLDSEKAFANTGLQILTNLRVDTRPCQDNYPIALPLSNTVMEEKLEDGISGTAPGEGGPRKNVYSPKPRTDFPETWMWEEAKLSADGKKTFEVEVPDTITSWYASGFAISKTAGLGIADSTQLRVFQPFFISLNLPYSVIRGEDVTVPAAVFSYLDDACITVKVSLSFSTEYRMIAGPSAKSCICGGRTATVLFRIKPKKLGHISIKISAKTLSENACAANRKYDNSVSMSDILIRKLLVTPEGVKKDYTISNFFCPKDSQSGEFTSEFDLQAPENLVPGSIFSKFMVIGDIMGSSLSNIDELLAMPYGCGEQNMLKFSPNIYIMNYLNSTNQMSSLIQRKAMNYMRTGYQRELTYKHDDGSYSAFGRRDTEGGSTWLTAFVLKSYAEARNWIEIDDKEIKDPFTWLLKQRDEFGCFLKVGQLHNKAMAGGVKTPITLTAYVITALMEAGLDEKDQVVQDAANCVARSIDQVDDTYSLAIIANMFSHMKIDRNSPSLYGPIMKKLLILGIREDGMLHFEEPKSKEEKKERQNWYYQARSTDIEQTAYALLAILNQQGKDGIPVSVPIVRWLSKQRNGLGGWSSTQDTILAMEGLSKFAGYTFGTSVDMKIELSAKNFIHDFQIHSNNNLVLQTVEDIPVPSTIKMKAKGSGCALVQAVVNYNIRKVEPKLNTFRISYKISNMRGKLSSQKTCLSQVLSVCVSWLGKEESNMALLEVEMVSGFQPNQYNFEKLQYSVKGLKDIEVKEKKVVFYFNRLSSNPRCVRLQVDQTAVVRKPKPVPLRVYDYYDTESAETKLYGFTSKQCTQFNG